MKTPGLQEHDQATLRHLGIFQPQLQLGLLHHAADIQRYVKHRPDPLLAQHPIILHQAETAFSGQDTQPLLIPGGVIFIRGRDPGGRSRIMGPILAGTNGALWSHDARPPGQYEKFS
jgi:hypothetical protein